MATNHLPFFIAELPLGRVPFLSQPPFFHQPQNTEREVAAPFLFSAPSMGCLPIEHRALGAETGSGTCISSVEAPGLVDELNEDTTQSLLVEWSV